MQKTIMKSHWVGDLTIAASTIPTVAHMYIRTCFIGQEIWVKQPL